MHLWQWAELKCVVFWWHASTWLSSHASLNKVQVQGMFTYPAEGISCKAVIQVQVCVQECWEYYNGMTMFGHHRDKTSGGWCGVEEEAENNRGRVTENEMIHVAACSGGCVAVKLNMTHYWISHLPLPLFVLPDCFMTFPYIQQFKYKKCWQPNRPRYWRAQCKVLSHVMLHICACDNTHPALTLYIPDSSGPENRSPPPPFSMSSVLLSLLDCPFPPHLNLISQQKYFLYILII